MILTNMRLPTHRAAACRPELMLLFLLAISLVLIVHQYSRAVFEQPVSSPSRRIKPSPKEGPGHLGVPVTIPPDVAQIPAAVQKQIALGWELQGYNQFVSDLISVHRELPDVRDPWCRRKQAQKTPLPSVSVVIVFHDEALSVLLRTVHSVLNRTPPELVQEILLVDDWSSMVQLKTFLDDYFLPYSGLVRILRTPQRIGLIQGRIFGAKQATAKHLLFLDAHCECLEGWLEPLLELVAHEDDVVAVPTIDWLNETTLALQPGPSSGLYGAFDWNLSFQWRPRYDRLQRHQANPLEPFNSPVMAGGLFCIGKAFFSRLGWYDPGLQTYGGENMELSFKVWMCGGVIKTVPCSRVAHIQKRNHPYIGSYIRERELTMKNSLRVAEVWMDEYANYFYRLHPDLQTLLKARSSDGMPNDGLSERKRLRSKLGCRSFRWYLQHVFPEQDDPTRSRAMGWVRTEQQLCLTWPMRDRSLALLRCHGLGGQQIWFHRKTGEITREGHCLTVETRQDLRHYVTMELCTSEWNTSTGKWQHRPETGQLMNIASGLCLTPTEDHFRLAVESCLPPERAATNSSVQRWTFQIAKI